ncbi:hypothetical protein [Litorivivens sp.]|uniref:ADP-ribosyltransferase-containing protein n=1 Tax=Litorivivens sp. TaxID=2020868 RepID=UPI003567175A
MSLADCLNKFGKSLDDNDVAIIQQRVTEGMSEVEAVESLMGDIDGEINQIVADVQAAGGSVAMSSPALDRARQEGYQGEDSREASEWSKAVAKGLDMSTEARMKRAREMGFDTDTPWYHGTDANFDEFVLTDDDAVNEMGYGYDNEAGIFLARNRKDAEFFAENAANVNREDGQNVMKLFARIKNPVEYDTFTDFRNDMDDSSEYRQEKMAEGFDGVVIRDTESNVSGDFHGDPWLIVFDPANIRSVNAAFDPDQAESADLLAQSAAADLSQVGQTETTIGTKFKTGEPVTFWYAHNPDSATKMMGKPKKGDQFGRDFEPSAKFVTPLDREPVDKSDGFEYGQITFNNPLVIENNGLKWKEQLSKAFGGKTGKRLSQAVIDAGFDGIVTVDEIRAGKYATETIDLTSFDPAIALYQSGQQRDLFVAHNLSAENILAANDLGGLAAPSIAVARAGISDFERFGEVTLLADPSLLTSKGVRTFDADVYSPRQPRAEYDINERGYAGLREMVGASVGDLPLSLPDMQSLSQDGADSLVRSEAAQYHWLNEQGKAPKLKNAKVDPEVRKAAKLGVQQYEAADTPAFVKIAEAYYKRSLDAAREVSPDRAERFESFWFDENGNVLRDKVRDFAIRVDEFNRTGGKDFGQLRKDIAKKMRVKANSGAYEKWVTDQFNGMVDGKQLFKGFTNAGNRKYVPYNMQNVVKEMTQKLQAGEGFLYGAGSARSAYANEMKSIADIQARREQIVPESDMEAIKEESQKVFEDALEKLKPFYKFDADSWGYADDAGSAIAEGPKGIREAFELNDESKKIIDDLTEYLRALPTSYFEAKAQRPVAFSEFSTAIVPRGMNKDALQVLKDAGLKIKTYNPKEEGARQALIEKQRDVLFQPAYHGTPHTFDKFSLDAIGTGEGAQAYGWGLYFAGKREIAEFYRDSVGGFTVDGKNITSDDNYIEGLSGLASLALVARNGDVDAAITYARTQIDPEVASELEEFDRGRIEKPEGSVYQVDIPEDSELLDWDKPLSEQPEGIADKFRAALKSDGWDALLDAIDSYDAGNENALKDAGFGVFAYPGAVGGAYQYVVSELGDRATSMLLNKAGIPGLRYLDATARDGSKDSHNYVIWDESRVTVEAVNDQLVQAQLAQQDDQQFRGELVMAASERFIRLGQISDLSTFIHESGHLFLEMEKVFALEFGVTPDQQALLDFLGLDSFDELKVRTEKGREAHEKFAETFEVYAREGKAPSLALRDAFEAFSRWIVRVYKNMLGQDLLKRADLNEEIRGVLDRMLATQEEIDAAMANPAYDQFFRSAEQAGMTDEQYAKYLAKVDKARNRASGDLYEKIVKQLRQRATREWKEERAQIAAVEEERLKREPIYQIIDDLAENKLDHDAVVEILGGKPSGRLIGKTQKGGVDPQEFAEIYGYRNVRTMLDDIVSADGLKKAASDAAEQKMIAKYGDILNDGSIENEAREAAHNTARADVLYEELKAINRGKPQIDRNILKANAKTLIGGLKYREIQPNKYYRAEIRAAQRAVTETDPGAQLEAKMQQLANHYLYKEALRVRERMDKQRKEVKRVKDRANAGKYDTRKVEKSYISNIAALANLYDMRNGNAKDIEIGKILNWYDGQLKNPNMYVNLNMLDPNLMNALVMRMNGQDTGYNMPTFDDMTASDLEGLVEMLRHLRYVGGKMSEEGLNAFSATREKMAQSIDENGGKDIIRRMGEKGRHDDAKKWTSEFVHRNASLRNLARVLDDGESGYAYSEIFRTIEDASDRKLEIQADLYRKFKEEMAGHHTLGITKAGHTDVTLTRDNGQPWTLSAAGRFMLAMNWGTESNRQAVMDGFDVTERDVLAMLGQMTPEQLQLVNATWRVNESLWPELSSASVDMMGVSPEKLPPTPFVVNGVKMTGGHMRLFYNGVSTEMREDIAAGEQMARVSPTRAGSTYARVGSGGKEVSLEISNLRRAWDDAAHWIAFAKPAQHIAGLVNSSAVRDAIVRKHGEGFYHALIKTITGITNNSGPQEQLKLLANISRVARSALTARYLMYSVRNIAQQPVSVFLAMKEVGPGQFIEAAMRVATQPSLRAMILEKSVKMRDRASLVNREAAEYMKTVEISGRAGNAWAVFKRHGFTPQTWIDAAVSYPAWLAKYESAIANDPNEENAVSAADTAVAESIGSGSDLHLGGIYQSTNAEWVKTVTMMGSWMGGIFNRIYRSSKGFSEFNRDVAMEAIVMPMIVAVASAALVMDWPEDEDPIEWLLKTYGKFLGGTVPILRDLVSMMSGFTPTSPVASAGSGLMSIPGEILDYVEGDQSFVKTASDVVGKGVASFVPIPGIGNMTRFVDYWESYEQGGEGDEFNPYQALTEGPNRND